MHQLNLDPRHRVAASAGTTVIQKGQEDYMDAAWDQVGDVVKANRKLRLARYAIEVSAGWFGRRFAAAALKPDRFLRLMRPVHRCVLSAGATVRSALDASLVGTSFLSFTASRALRPGGLLARMAAQGKRIDGGAMLVALNEGRIRIARPKAAPRGLPTLDNLAEKSVPGAIAAKRVPRSRVRAALEMAKLLADPRASAESFARIRRLESIAIGDPEGRQRDASRAAREETEKLAIAAAAWFDLVGASHAAAARPESRRIDLRTVAGAIGAAIDPRVALRARTLRGLAIPPRIVAALPEEFDKVMHHPVIDTPMYKPLEQVSKDFRIPGLSLV